MSIYRLGVILHYQKFINLIKPQWNIQVSGSALVTWISTCDIIYGVQLKLKNEESEPQLGVKVLMN